jgi:probable rRNA maturation factor
VSVEVTVVNRQRGYCVAREPLRQFVHALVRAAPPPAHDSVALALVSEPRMRRLNRAHRGKDTATDVLSFADDEREGPAGPRHLGDIVICVAAAARQARGARHSLTRELQRLALHGYLHLLGHDHEVDGGTMRRLERRLARRLGCADVPAGAR